MITHNFENNDITCNTIVIHGTCHYVLVYVLTDYIICAYNVKAKGHLSFLTKSEKKEFILTLKFFEYSSDGTLCRVQNNLKYLSIYKRRVLNLLCNLIRNLYRCNWLHYKPVIYLLFSILYKEC